LIALTAAAGCGGGTESDEVPVTSAITATESTATEASISAGKAAYLQRCVGCHGIDGSGIVGPDIRPGKVLEKYASAETMEALIRDGLGEMPEFGSKLSDDEIAAVVAYVRGGLG
jgi:mono/diheme cytochrome c family protein